MKIFLAAPISGFDTAHEYTKFHQEVISLISELRKDFSVFSELERIESAENYDSPEQSVKEDLRLINGADMFVLLHPKKMQTSSLIELGYAYALKKNILIVSDKKNLPYMALGLKNSNNEVEILSPEDGYSEIIRVLSKWNNDSKK